MSKIKDAFICDICDGEGRVFSPFAPATDPHGSTIRCPFCHGRGFHSEESPDDDDPDIGF